MLFSDALEFIFPKYPILSWTLKSESSCFFITCTPQVFSSVLLLSSQQVHLTGIQYIFFFWMIKCSRKQSKAKLNRIQRREKGKEERGEQSTFLSHLLSPASRAISGLRRHRRGGGSPRGSWITSSARRERSVVGTPGSLLPIAARWSAPGGGGGGGPYLGPL